MIVATLVKTDYIENDSSPLHPLHPEGFVISYRLETCDNPTMVKFPPAFSFSLLDLIQ